MHGVQKLDPVNVGRLMHHNVARHGVSSRDSPAQAGNPHCFLQQDRPTWDTSPRRQPTPLHGYERPRRQHRPTTEVTQDRAGDQATGVLP
jgi:hypothetical protein